MNVIKWRRRPKKINLLWKNGINSNTPTMSEKNFYFIEIGFSIAPTVNFSNAPTIRFN